MNKYVDYLDNELKHYIEDKNVILNNIRSIQFDIEQFDIRIKDFDLSKNSGDKLFLGFSNDFEKLESAKLLKSKKQLEEELVLLNQKLDFNNKKIEEINYIKECILNQYLIDNSTVETIKNKLSFISSFISTDTNRAFIELNQLCDDLEASLKNNYKSHNVSETFVPKKNLIFTKGLFDSVTNMIDKYVMDYSTISTSFSGDDSIISQNLVSVIMFILNDLLELYSRKYDNLKIIINVLNGKVRLFIIENENHYLIKFDFHF